MSPQELLALIANGEDTRHQFKRDFAHIDALAAELVALANTVGGMLLVGVADDGLIVGLSANDITRLNQMLSNAASQHVKPPINPITANVRTEQGLVMVIEVESGLNKPYMDAQGRIWVKSGADKRQVTAREEMQRMFQQSGLIHADEIPAGHSRVAEQYQRSTAFIKRNLRHVQGRQGFNSPGQLEIPEAVFEEILVNALVHRDYFINASIRLLIFADRVEVISPGHLPNHLDAEQIRFGLSNLRNPALASHAFRLLPYRGLGSGIPRAMAAWPEIELIDDRRGNQFKAIVKRPMQRAEGVTGGVSEGASEGVDLLLAHIQKEPGLRAPMLASRMDTSVKNVERWLKQLKSQQFIEFRGAPKTGGYHPKEQGKINNT